MFRSFCVRIPSFPHFPALDKCLFSVRSSLVRLLAEGLYGVGISLVPRTSCENCKTILSLEVNFDILQN